MLVNTLNGLLVTAVPTPEAGTYAFRVLERYYGQAPGGGDLDVTYRVRVAAADVRFHPADGGFVLALRPSVFDAVERRVRDRLADEAAVYPAF